MLKIMVVLFSLTLVLWRMDVELGSVLALAEGIMLLVIFGKRNPCLGKRISYLKTTIHSFSTYSVAKFFNFTLTNCAFFCFLTATKILFTTELDN